MEWTSWILGILLVGFSIFPFYSKIKEYFRMIRLMNEIPGPTSYYFIGTAYLFLRKTREQIFDLAMGLDKKFAGKKGIFRLMHGALPEVKVKVNKLINKSKNINKFQVSRCEYAEEIFKSTQIIEKAFVYDFIKPWLGEGLLTSTGPKWFKHRKIITPTFHFSVLDNFCTVFGENCKVLVDQLSKVSDTRKAVNVYPFITKVALDIICETAMGIQIHAQEQKESNDYINAVYNFSTFVIEKILNPLYHIDFIYKRSELGAKTNKALKILHEFTTKVIKDRKLARSIEGKKEIIEDDVGSKKRIAFLDMLLDANENDAGLTDIDIREEVDTFMFEGHDTTTVGMSWALLMIALHPEVQEKIQEELKEIFGDDVSRSATMHDLNQMNYLERVIKETLRLYPSVPAISRRVPIEFELGGYTIPRDCMITLEIYQIHRDPEYFPDPEKFDPDRFLPENTENRHPFAYVAFSAGMRNCIGQRFAILEEKAVLSSILRNYKISSPCKTRQEVFGFGELVLRPIYGIDLFFEKRNK